MSEVADEKLTSLANEKIIDEAMAAKLFEKVCRGLEILHKGIDGTSYVHCDIKPRIF